MIPLERTVWITIFLVALAASAATARAQADLLKPGQPLSFSLSPGEARTFRLAMKQDDFAELDWKAPEGVYLHFRITDPAGNELAASNSDFNDSAMFVAPRDGVNGRRIRNGAFDSHASGPTRYRMRPSEMLRNARTSPGSNCTPEQRTSSARASAGVAATLYERTDVITS